MINKLDKKIFSNTFYQIFGKLITSSLGFLATILIARYLGVIGFGQYNLIFTFLGLTAIFSDFGLATLLIREVSAKRAEEKYISAIFTLRLILTLLLLTVSILILPFFPYMVLLKSGIILALFGNLFLNLSSVYWAIFQAKLNFLKPVLIQVMSSFVTTILVFLGIIKSYSLLYLVLATVAGNLTDFILSFLMGPKIYLLLDNKIFKKILAEVWPIGLWAVASTFYFKIGTVLLSIFFDPSKYPDLGLYSASYKYFEVAGVLVGYFQLTTFPIISSKLAKKGFSKLLKKLFWLSLALALISSVGLFWAAGFLGSILGHDFLPAAGSLKILSISLGLSVLSGVWVSTAVAAGRQKEILTYSACALLLNFILNLIFIPKFSFIGVSWIMVLTQIFITATDYLVARKVIRKQ